MGGVLEGFVRHVGVTDVRLALVGPAVSGVSDDPEGEQIWESAWRRGARSPGTSANVSSSRLSRWTTRWRTHSSSTRFSGMRRSSSRRASPRGSGSPWRRPCGRAARSSRAPSAGSSTRSSTARRPPASRIRTTSRASAPRSSDCCATAGGRAWANARSHVERHFLGDRHLLDYSALIAEAVIDTELAIPNASAPATVPLADWRGMTDATDQVRGDEDDCARRTTERSGALRRPCIRHRSREGASCKQTAATKSFTSQPASRSASTSSSRPSPIISNPTSTTRSTSSSRAEERLTSKARQVDLREGHAVFVPAGAKHQFVGYEQLSVLVIFSEKREP